MPLRSTRGDPPFVSARRTAASGFRITGPPSRSGNRPHRPQIIENLAVGANAGMIAVASAGHGSVFAPSSRRHPRFGKVRQVGTASDRRSSVLVSGDPKGRSSGNPKAISAEFLEKNSRKCARARQRARLRTSPLGNGAPSYIPLRLGGASGQLIADS